MTQDTQNQFKTLSAPVLVGLLGDIAITAQQIACLSLQASDASHGDSHKVDMLVSAIGSLAQRVGWIADTAIGDFGQNSPLVGDAVEWMLPGVAGAIKGQS